MGVVSVNLVRCAIKARTEEGFWRELDSAVLLAKKALDLRVSTCKQIKAKSAPILYMEGAFGLRTNDPEELVFDRFFSKQRASISLGYIGLHEVCTLLFGEGHHTNNEAHKFAVDIVKRLKKYTDTWKEAEDLGYSVYGTPSEGMAGKFCRADQKKFGDIQGVTDKGYYMNAFNVDVTADISPFDKCQVEAEFPKHARGGFISYGELPSMINNLKGLEVVIDFALDNVPYYAVNCPSDKCLVCGFEGEFNTTANGYCCPSCINSNPYEMNVIRRISGYLSSLNVRNTDKGKFQEICNRVKNH